MTTPLLLMAAIWFGGRFLNVPRNPRLAFIALLFVVGMAAHFVLPSESGLRRLFGREWGEWALVGIAIGGLWGGQAWISWLREKARDRSPSDGEEILSKPAFSDVEIDRYARHLFLREIGGAGQKRLKNAKVLVIGAGGLGAPALQYLAAAGVGVIGVIDDDEVDNSNLQRQVIHNDASIGEPKVFSAEKEMRAQNPFIEVRPYNRRLDRDLAAKLFADYDLILDGTDNFETRYMVNEVAVALKKPLISAAMTQWEGQISTYDPSRGGPCYQCVFPEKPAPGLVPSCAEAGVVGPLPGVIGSMMALEAVKEITKAGEGLLGQLFMFDGLYGETRKITVKPRANCSICGEESP